jgi:hypothetical protein
MLPLCHTHDMADELGTDSTGTCDLHLVPPDTDALFVERTLAAWRRTVAAGSINDARALARQWLDAMHDRELTTDDVTLLMLAYASPQGPVGLLPAQSARLAELEAAGWRERRDGALAEPA